MATKYTVKKGDTLSGIGKQFGVNYMDIAKANGISNPNLIYDGQVLTIDTPSTSGTTTQGTAGGSTTGDGATAPAEPTTPPKYEYTPYTPSEAVKQADALLQQHIAQKPGAYTSPLGDQLTEIMNQINNREKFSYDLNADMLYQQYKDQHTTQGKLAMMDTMGQAAALTGGYGNSYAQTAGQQAYQGHLQQLNNMIPELYQLALNQYNTEGDEMYRKAALMAQQEAQEYGRYRDDVSDYYANLDYYTDDSRYKAEQEYKKWADDQSIRYQQDRDQVAEDQWERTFAEGVRQFDLQYNKTSNSGGSSGGSRGSSGSSGSRGSGSSSSSAAALAAGTASAITAAANAVGGFTGSTYSEAASYIKSKGGSVGGLMTKNEWQRRKSAYNQTGQGGTEVTAYSSYEAYLKAYVKYATQ